MPESSQKKISISEENQLLILFEKYIEDCQFVRRLSPHTIKGYREVFSTFQKILPEINSVENLQANTVSEFFKRLSIRRRYEGSHLKIGVKPSTISTYYNKLMAFFRWLEINNYISDGFITKKIRRPPTPKYTDNRSLEAEEVSKIIAAITMSTIDDEFLRARDLTIINTLLYLGVRRSELLGLRLQDIDFDKRRVFINEETSKSEDSRYIPLHPILELQIKELLRIRKERHSTCMYLITSSKEDKALSQHGLKHWVARYKQASGVRFHLHRFRHTFTCALAKKGADITSIMRLLGHTSSRMTETYLRSIRPEDSHHIIDKLSF